MAAITVFVFFFRTLFDLLIEVFSNIQVRTLVTDFRNAADTNFYGEILRQVEDLDISIVVHCVGMASLTKKFHLQLADKNRQ